jgi:hypothetical protein
LLVNFLLTESIFRRIIFTYKATVFFSPSACKLKAAFLLNDFG